MKYRSWPDWTDSGGVHGNAQWFHKCGKFHDNLINNLYITFIVIINTVVCFVLVENSYTAPFSNSNLKRLELSKTQYRWRASNRATCQLCRCTTMIVKQVQTQNTFEYTTHYLHRRRRCYLLTANKAWKENTIEKCSQWHVRNNEHLLTVRWFRSWYKWCLFFVPVCFKLQLIHTADQPEA